MLKLIEALEDNDDVQNVWANFDISEKEMEAAAARLGPERLRARHDHPRRRPRLAAHRLRRHRDGRPPPPPDRDGRRSRRAAPARSPTRLRHIHDGIARAHRAPAARRARRRGHLPRRQHAHGARPRPRARRRAPRGRAGGPPGPRVPAGHRQAQVTGFGRAEKTPGRVHGRAPARARRRTAEPGDATDALAVALCSRARRLDRRGLAPRGARA